MQFTGFLAARWALFEVLAPLQLLVRLVTSANVGRRRPRDSGETEKSDTSTGVFRGSGSMRSTRCAVPRRM